MNRFSGAILLAGALLAPTAMAAAEEFWDPRCDTGGEFCWVPMEALLAVPDRYDGRIVRVTGVAAVYGRDELRIYASRDAADIEDGPSALVLDLREVRRVVPDLHALEGRMVTVQGEFDYWGNGRGLGAISGFNGVQVRLTPKEMRAVGPPGRKIPK